MDDQNQQGQHQNQDQPPVVGDAKHQIAERLKQANNVLVTVSNNPSVDQLAACIGLTLVLNKMNKHATAVFSGDVPSTIEFLKPEETIERTTDSLRDFIIALDKSKADKLRYKVEDKVVKIFITPYRTSISQNDLEFSQGDFNVDVVVAIGVHEQQDLDQAITSHGRILHDATVTTVSVTSPTELGAINWHDPGASSLSEAVTDLINQLGTKLIDSQIATALLTGIVAETDRFSNDKTSPQTMSTSAALMVAGANQQLISTKLEQPAPQVTEPQGFSGPEHVEPVSNTPKGTLEIKHNNDERHDENRPPAAADDEEELERLAVAELAKQQQIHIDNDGLIHQLTNDTPGHQGSAGQTSSSSGSPSGSHLIIEPPHHDGFLANRHEEPAEPKTKVGDVDLSLSLPQVVHPSQTPERTEPTRPPMPNPEPFNERLVPAPGPTLQPQSPPPSTTLTAPKTLSQIEEAVDSSHVRKLDQGNVMHVPPTPEPSAAEIDRLSEAAKVAAEASQPLPRPEAFSSQYLADNIQQNQPAPPSVQPEPAPFSEPLPRSYEASPGALTDQPPTMPLPPSNYQNNVAAPTIPEQPMSMPTPSPDQPPAPPVPPPMTFPPAI